MFPLIRLLIRIATFKTPVGSLRMPLEWGHTECPGCGRSIEMRPNDPRFIQLRSYRDGGAAGGGAPIIPGCCVVCGGPLARKKRKKTGNSDLPSGEPADEAAGGRKRKPKASPGPLLGVPLPFWGLIAACVFAFLLWRCFGGSVLSWALRPHTPPPTPRYRGATEEKANPTGVREV
jgi:hypothetical protein